ncbi:fatty acid desaturase [Ureibacillus sp. FSL K6-8385]|uniref:Fatty acid desaturase n=1 Tax=Ureibacillus terrenus TaxID=118246 RepID=A0A540UY61_9BACL|nr:fatty acid desaturase [Ureibacillus terrenus]MED3662592.1 fatty acid desaturase [Ureibacillus terrenus]MED3762834.1 fatty acid desaturase [Ureibacillus terrenus]TQE89436.1 fatty acid desaturase [Ureibacillus terrenus]
MSMTDAEKTKKLRREVAPFAKSETKKSVIQIINTILPLLFFWGIGYSFANTNPWVSVLCGVIASGFVVRTFIIFHDCTHGSFFKSKKANDAVGNITGILTSFPYEKWRREHLIHHATSGNLDKRGIGDIDMLTVDEYLALSATKRFFYRLYRNPFVMFGLGPLYLVLVLNRFNRNDAKMKERLNTHFTNVALALMITGLIVSFGWEAVLLVHGITLFIAGSLGIWLFYIQHTYEESYFEYDPEWDYVKAAVEGSSFYKLPKALQWITGNIGYHHVHHLAPRVPNYYLEAAHNSVPPLQKATTITIRTSLESVRYKLYDPKKKKFVSFKEVGKVYSGRKIKSAEA